MRLVSKESGAPQEVSAERQARVDLAAAHRLAVMHGFHEGICNHLTLTLPGSTDRFLLIPYGLHWSEVTASDFMEVTYDGRIIKGNGVAEATAFCIHAPIHKLRPEAACVLHTHMPYASAFARLEDMTLEMIGQTEVGLYDLLAYDSDYTGIAFDPGEGERLAGVLGGKSVMFMANHGVLVTGESVAQAYDRLYYLERACQTQLYAMWTGRKLRQIPQEQLQRTVEQFRNIPHQAGVPPWETHFAALKRILDRKEPDYAA
ncbi:MAG TPA: aldolase [Stellaceae bacterium]|nr:aldolase [Stellaceae bacterium]